MKSLKTLENETKGKEVSLESFTKIFGFCSWNDMPGKQLDFSERAKFMSSNLSTHQKQQLHAPVHFTFFYLNYV